MKRILSSLLVIAATLGAKSQDNPKYLSLQETIDAAIANNNAVKVSAIDEKIAEAKFRQTDAIFLPQANLSYTALSTNNPLNAFGFKLQQKSITPSDFNPELLNRPSSTPDFTTRVEVQQPLVNIDMLYQRKGAAKQLQVYKLITQRTKEHLSFESRKAYLQLQMLYEADKVLKEALVTSMEVYKDSKNYFEQGLIQKSDLLNAELHVTNIETQLNTSKSNIRDASDMLSLLMGTAMGVVYNVEPIAKAQNIPPDSIRVPDDRADFRALQEAMQGYDLMTRSSRMSHLPKLNAFASYQMNDKSMLGFDARSYLAGIQLSWNIFNGNRTKNIITQQNLEKEKLAKQLDQQKNEAQTQLNHANRQLSDASFNMKKQELAVEQASEALRVTQNRYAQSLVKTSDILMAQTQLSQQQLSYVQAIFNYNMVTAYLQFLTTNN